MSRARDLADLGGSADAGGLTGRSMLINGAFQIWQRGTSAITVSGDDIFAADRFKGWANGGGTFTVEQSTDVPNNEFEFSAKLTNTATDGSVAAGDFYAYATDIEGYNVSQLAYGHSDAKAVTLSFWVKSSLTGTYCIALYSTTADRSHIKEYTISSANTWEKKTITITSGDTTGSWNRTNGNGLRIYWDLGSGSTYQASADTWLASQDFSTTNQAAWIGSSSATFYITGVQLEIGETATPFEHRSHGDELARCQRYYVQLINGSDHSVSIGSALGSGANQARAVVQFPVEMRSSPSIVSNSGTNYFTIEGIISFDGPMLTTYKNTRAAMLYFSTGTTLTTGQSGVFRSNNASTSLAFKAEL